MSAEAARLLLFYGVVPLWILAGLADWACHRGSGIERTAGVPENAFHWVLFAEAGIGIVPAVLCESNTGVMLLLAGSFLVHEATVWLELRYAAPRRPIRPVEQMVHSFMEILPLAALALVAVAGWGERSLALQLRDGAGPIAAVLLTAVTLLNVLPLAEETVRCRRGAAR